MKEDEGSSLNAQIQYKFIEKLVSQNEEKDKRATELVIANKELANYKYAFDQSSIVSITDQKGIIRYANDTFCKISKFSTEELIGKDHRIISSGYHTKEYIRNLWTTIANGKAWKGELKNKAKDGTFYWVDSTIIPFLDEQGEIYQYVAVRFDITERKNIDEVIKKVSSNLASIIEGTRMATWEWNIQTGETVFSESWAQIIGFTLVELEPISINTWGKYAHPDDLLESGKLLEKHFLGELPYYEFESRMKHKNGHWVWVLDRGKVKTWSADGKPLLMFGSHMDITDRKIAELELQKTKELLEKTNAVAKIGSWDMNLITNDIEWTLEHYRTFEIDPLVPPNEIYQAFRSKIHPDDIENLDKVVGEAMKYGRDFRYEHRVLLPDNRMKYVLGIGAVYKDNAGNVIGVRGTNQDITESKISELELQKTKNLLEQTNAVAKIGTWDYNVITYNLYWTKECYVIFEIDEKTITPDTLYEAFRSKIHPEDWPQFEELMDKAIKERLDYIYECRVLCANGKTKYILNTGTTHKDIDGNIIGLRGTIQDVTERKKIENELTLAFSRMSSLITNLNTGILLESADRKIALTNDIFCEIFGIPATPEQLVGADCRESAKQVKHLFANPDRFESDISSLLNKREKVIGQELIMNNGNIYERDFIPVISGDEYLGHLWQYRDVTSAKLAEEQIKAVNNELEAFSYSVSHDLRAPLRAIDGYSRVLIEDYGNKLDDEGKRTLNVIMKNALRMGQLIDDFLAFSRIGKQNLVKVNVDMSSLVNTIAAELNIQQSNKIEMDIKSLPGAKCDSSMMRQVMTNLIGNALKYSGKKEKSIIEIGSYKDKENTIYYVKDNGAGFDMKYYDKLFGVFQRLHGANEFEGSGVGLALVQRIITKHGGKVWAEAKVDEGAIFYFSLPIQ